MICHAPRALGVVYQIALAPFNRWTAQDWRGKGEIYLRFHCALCHFEEGIGLEITFNKIIAVYEGEVEPSFRCFAAVRTKQLMELTGSASSMRRFYSPPWRGRATTPPQAPGILTRPSVEISAYFKQIFFAPPGTSQAGTANTLDLLHDEKLARIEFKSLVIPRTDCPQDAAIQSINIRASTLSGHYERIMNHFLSSAMDLHRDAEPGVVENPVFCI